MLRIRFGFCFIRLGNVNEVNDLFILNLSMYLGF